MAQTPESYALNIRRQRFYGDSDTGALGSRGRKLRLGLNESSLFNHFGAE